ISCVCILFLFFFTLFFFFFSVIFLFSFLFFFNDTATTEIYTLSLHDALPIFSVTHQDNGVHGGVRHRLAERIHHTVGGHRDLLMIRHVSEAYRHCVTRNGGARDVTSARSHAGATAGEVVRERKDERVSASG